MSHEMTSAEKRIRRLEEEILALRKALESLAHKAGQASEDGARQFQDTGAGGSGLIRAQSVGVIPAASSGGPGVGTARLIQLISGSWYKLQPIAMGDVTVDCANDTGSPTINNEHLIGSYIDGIFTAILGDCVTVAPVVAPDPPA